MQNGEAPLSSAYGQTTVSLYTGSSLVQTEIAALGTVADPSTDTEVLITIDPTWGRESLARLPPDARSPSLTGRRVTLRSRLGRLLHPDPVGRGRRQHRRAPPGLLRALCARLGCSPLPSLLPTTDPP